MTKATRRLDYLNTLGVQVWFDRSVGPAQFKDVAAINEAGECNALLSVGSNNAKIFILSAFPSEEDEQQAQPFTGDEWQLLMQIIQALGLSRESVYLTNSVDTPSAGNEQIDKEQLTRCREYLIEQIRQVSPNVILVLGEVAAQSLLKSTACLMELSSNPQSVNDIEPSIVVCEQLRCLIQQPLRKKQAWSSLLRLKEQL